MSDQKTQIHLCKTPYNILLSSILSASHDSRSILIIDPWFQQEFVTEISESLSQKEIFSDIIQLESIYNGKYKKEYRRQLVTIRQNINKINRVLDEVLDKRKVLEVYTFAETKEIDQFIIQKAKEDYSSEFIHVEDGVSAYYEMSDSWSELMSVSNVKNMKLIPNLIHIFRLYIKYKFVWKRINAFGEFEPIDRCIVLYPEFARNGLKRQTVGSLPEKELWETEIQDWIQEYYEINNISLRNLSVEHLLILPYSKGQISVNEINRIVNYYKNKMGNVAVKPHPKEKSDYWSDRDVMVLPQKLPVEFLYINSSTNLKTVAGFRSSAIHTSRYFCSDVKTISLYKLIDHDEEFVHFYKNIGVKLPNSMDELDLYFQEYRR